MKYKSSDGSSSQYLNLKNNPYPTKSISNLHTNIQNLYVFPFYICKTKICIQKDTSKIYCIQPNNFK